MAALMGTSTTALDLCVTGGLGAPQAVAGSKPHREW